MDYLSTLFSDTDSLSSSRADHFSANNTDEGARCQSIVHIYTEHTKSRGHSVCIPRATHTIH